MEAHARLHLWGPPLGCSTLQSLGWGFPVTSAASSAPSAHRCTPANMRAHASSGFAQSPNPCKDPSRNLISASSKPSKMLMLSDIDNYQHASGISHLQRQDADLEEIVQPIPNEDCYGNEVLHGTGHPSIHPRITYSSCRAQNLQ